VHFKLVKSEVSIFTDDNSLSFEFVMRNRRSIKSFKKWILIEVSSDLEGDDEALKYVGAFCCLLLGEYKLPKQLENTILRLLNDGKEFLNDKAQKDLARILNQACQNFGVRGKSFPSQVRSHYHFKNFYASAKERQSVLDWRAMTISEYLSATTQIYKKIIDGNLDALISALALILGLPKHLVIQVPFLSKYSDDWIIAIDLEQGLVLFDLAQIFPDGAKLRNEVESFEQSSNILVKPIPKYLKDELLKLYLRKSEAKSLRDVIGVFDDNVDCNQMSRLLNTTAKFAINSCGIDAFNAAVISGDFRGIATAKTYYRRTTRQTVWHSSNHFYKAIGWGESVDFIDGLAFGSQVVVKDEVLTGVFAHLSLNLNKLRPSNRCGVERLLEFHNVFCNYTATFTIFCLALRNANPIGLLSNDFDEDRRFIVIDDKHVIGTASALPVAVTNSLAIQLSYWRVHCAVLLKRLKKVNYTDQKFILLLKGVVDYQKSSLLVMSEKPYAVSVVRVATSWNATLVGNFGRHFWESKFAQVGISSRFSAAHLRHQSSGALSWAGDSDFVLVEFTKAISSAQEKVLNDLKVMPIHGLSKR